MNTIRTNTTLYRVAFAAVLALAFALACAAFVPQAFANRQLDAPVTVSDDVTRVNVHKLDADTHEYVGGAKMAIIEKDTGTVVDEWVTGSAVHENEKGLDVGVTYILREVEPPEGYDAVQDVEFIVNKTEGSGVTIVSQGNDCELTESYVFNLYDKKQPIENDEVVTKTKESETPVYKTEKDSKTSKEVAPKTGDETPMSLIGLLVAAGVILIGILQLAKMRIGKKE